MRKLEMLGKMRGFLLALAGIALGGTVLISLTSTTASNRENLLSNMSIFATLLLLWLLVIAAVGIMYVASQGNRVIKPIPLLINGEEE